MKSLDHPYANLTGGQWLRGNLHCHSTRSDGTRPPQEVIDDYARRGYDFLMLSDHDLCTTPEECGVWDARGMVFLRGNEISANGPHLLHVNADRRIEPARQRQEVLQAIHAANAERAAGDPGGFAIFNHPNWHANFNHCTIEQLREWVGYAGIEIFNGVISVLDGSPYATNKWDMLLTEGRKLWGFANDDCHWGDRDIELGWNVAYARERSVAGVVEALTSGRFYASTGVTITDVEVRGMTIKVRTRDAQRIVALMNTAKRFAQADAAEIEVTVPDNARYVRFECWGAAERFAWTQPFFVNEA
jgi:hypothetical protein